jgi:hypothetical protein
VSYLFDGTDDVAEYTAGAIVTAAPCSFLIWFKIPTTLKDAVLMSAATAGAGNHMFALVTQGDGDLRAEARTTATNAAQSAGVLSADNAWHCALAVYTSATSRDVYFDGVAGTPSATSQAPSTINMFAIGDRPGVTQHFAGLIAYPTVWDAALTSGNAATLFNSGFGTDPRNVGSPVAFWDTSVDQGGTLADEIAAFDLTVTGAVHDADDPFVLGGGGAASILLQMLAHHGG